MYDPANMRCYVIAEIGVNHNGNVDLAKEMIDAAKESGADAVKFQTFTAASLVTSSTPKVGYQVKTTGAGESHYEMIAKLELGRDAHRDLFEHCARFGIDFISTPYDIDSARFLDELGVACFKVASADIVDLPLHEFLAQTRKPIILATGMARLGEIEDAITMYRRHRNDRLTLLQCVSNYPCADESLNLRVIETLRGAFGYPVGFSDHSVDSHAAIVAVSLGAQVIEKHFTLDKHLPGPDHRASSSPDEFARLVDDIRRTERILGIPVKACQNEEKEMSRVSRKSVVTVQPLRTGHILVRGDLATKRPGTGLAPKRLYELIGRRVTLDLPKDYLISNCDTEPR